MVPEALSIAITVRMMMAPAARTTSRPVALRIEQRPKFFERQPRLSEHFVKQPFGNVALVLVADPNSQDRPVRQELSLGFVLFRSEMFEPCTLEHNTEIVIHERGHA
jgi:hypothetical protein